MEQNPAVTLREAAQYLEELAGPNPKAWNLLAQEGVFGTYIKVEDGSIRVPTRYVGKLLALHDPQVLFLLADVLNGLADAAEDGIEPEAGWLAYAEAVLLKKNQTGRL
jgi:hypothetical protein